MPLKSANERLLERKLHATFDIRPLHSNFAKNIIFSGNLFKLQLSSTREVEPRLVVSVAFMTNGLIEHVKIGSAWGTCSNISVLHMRTPQSAYGPKVLKDTAEKPSSSNKKSWGKNSQRKA